MKIFYVYILHFLMLFMPLLAKAQFTPNTPICPGTTVTYSITSSVFAGKTLDWQVTGGVFTNTNYYQSNNMGTANIIKWNNNITGGSFTVTDHNQGSLTQTFSVSVTPITQPYESENVNIACGVAGNIQIIIKIDKADPSSSTAQGYVADSRNFTFPAGVSYVSQTALTDLTEFGKTYTRTQVTLSVNNTATGQIKFKSFYSCSSNPNSTGILSSTEIPILIIRTNPTNISLTGNQQGCLNQSGSYSLVNLPSGASTVWSTTGPHTIASSSSSGITVNYGGSDGIGTIKALITTACGATAVSQITVGVGSPNISTINYDNYPNSGPSPASSGSTHYISVNSSNDLNASYSLGVTNNYGDINVSLSGVNGGNAQIYTYGTYGNSAINIGATNVCGSNSAAFIIYIPSGYRIGPNPAKESLIVEFTDTKNQLALPDQIDIISEKTMLAVRSINIGEMFKSGGFDDGNKVTFDTNDLPRGTYYLKVINPRQEKEKQVEMTRLYFE